MTLKLGFALTLPLGEIEVSIRDGRVQNNQSLRDRRVHLVQEEQTALRKSFIKLGFLIIAVGINEASQLVLLRNGVGDPDPELPQPADK